MVGLGAVPMAVPHTRPIAVTPHANRAELMTGQSPWRGELRIPSSAQALLELRLGEWGHDALGYVAHVPHYLAQLDYPKAAVALLEDVERGGRLTIDLTVLRAAAEEREAEISRYLDDNAEVAEVVAGLEQQYDAFQQAEEAGASLLATGEPLPTGEEIGLQFEQFLAGLDQPDPDAGGPTADGTTEVPASAAELVELLDLEQLDLDLFRGRQPDTDRQRVFGGQVAAQALMAAMRTVDVEHTVHSLHSYFLLPGRHLGADRLRRGADPRRQSFDTRRVVARQHGRPIYYVTASFQRAEDGLEHQDLMPEVVPPEQAMDFLDLMRARGGPRAPRRWRRSGRRSTSGSSGRPATDCPRTPPIPPGRSCGCASTVTSARIGGSTPRPSPMPAT